MLRHVHVTGWVLTIGSLLFLVGASLPPEPSRVFSAPLEEHLGIIHRQRSRWGWMNRLMIASIVTTIAGLFMLATVLGSPMRAVAGAAIFAVGGVFWIVALMFRDSVMVWSAAEADRIGAAPTWLAPFQEWTGQMFWAYMLIGYVAIGLFGWVLVSANLLADWVGWFALIYGVLLGLLFATSALKVKMWGPIAEPPFLIHVPFLVIGIAMLLA